MRHFLIVFALLGSFTFAAEIEADMDTDSGESCTSTRWCINPNEHCLKGVCQARDAFNRCFTDFDCSFGYDRCVSGVCEPN